MDLQPIHPQEATSSSGASVSNSLLDSSTAVSSFESKNLRSSARVRAAKQNNKLKGKGKERDLSLSEQPSAANSSEPSTSRITRSSSNSIRATRSKDSASGKPKPKEETPLRPNKRYVITSFVTPTSL